MKVQPPYYKSRPLDNQFDDGFGLIADSFQEAAEHLEKVENKESSLHSLLPICFLYRHAIELYLKSLIVIIHRRLKIP